MQKHGNQPPTGAARDTQATKEDKEHAPWHERGEQREDTNTKWVSEGQLVTKEVPGGDGLGQATQLWKRMAPSICPRVAREVGWLADAANSLCSTTSCVPLVPACLHSVAHPPAD